MIQVKLPFSASVTRGPLVTPQSCSIQTLSADWKPDLMRLEDWAGQSLIILVEATYCVIQPVSLIHSFSGSSAQYNPIGLQRW